jgi:hypothetical protein
MISWGVHSSTRGVVFALRCKSYRIPIEGCSPLADGPLKSRDSDEVKAGVGRAAEATPLVIADDNRRKTPC